MNASPWGFSVGAGLGVLLALVALLVADNGGAATAAIAEASHAESLGDWITANLGHSVWLFGAVLVLYVLNLARLNRSLADASNPTEIVELDQLIDVWTHLFVGIGVIWTAVGMRSALQSALGDPNAALADGASNVLQKLVDGGILLALTTTIVGGIGGYLMRLVKTLLVGATLHEHYEQSAREDLQQLHHLVARIETNLQSRTAIPPTQQSGDSRRAEQHPSAEPHV